MRLFRRTGSSSIGKPLSSGQEKFAEKIAGRILSAQRRTADYLNAKTAKVSPKTWLYLLNCFCAAFSAYLIYLLAQVFN